MNIITRVVCGLVTVVKHIPAYYKCFAVGSTLKDQNGNDVYTRKLVCLDVDRIIIPHGPPVSQHYHAC